MQCSGDQLFARSRLARLQHGRPAGRNFPDQRLHGANRRAFAHQRGNVSLSVKLASQRLIFPEQPTEADQAVDSRDQVLEKTGFIR